MLHLYRRHRKSCKHTAWTYRRCQCPIYVKGALGGVSIKMSLDQTSWNAATQIVADWTKAGKIGQTHDVQTQQLSHVIERFLADVKDRGLGAGTQKKYQTLLEGRLVKWADTAGVRFLSELTLDQLSAFRASWPDAPLTKQKNQERLKAFLRWCVARGWLSENPASGLSTIKVKMVPTLPFSAEEVSRILAACEQYPTRNSYGHDNRTRLLAFVLLLRWTGLRIGDVVTLEWEAIEDGRVRLYTQKTGVRVAVPLPQQVLDVIAKLPQLGRHVFWSGNGHPKSAVADWQRSLRTLFEIAKVEGGHAHRFRDTFAVELLLAGVDLVDVSMLLGHSSVKVTEKHYSPWVSARQSRLETSVRRVWGAGTRSSDPATTSAPDRAQTAVSESPAPDAEPQPRTGTDDAPIPETRSRVLQFPSERSTALQS